jgi:hypothetical protein
VAQGGPQGCVIGKYLEIRDGEWGREPKEGVLRAQREEKRKDGVRRKWKTAKEKERVRSNDFTRTEKSRTE